MQFCRYTVDSWIRTPWPASTNEAMPSPPAIAAMAETHLLAAKEVRGGRTRTSIAELAGDTRVREVAEMIAGGAGEATALAEARRLLG